MASSRHCSATKLELSFQKRRRSLLSSKHTTGLRSTAKAHGCPLTPKRFGPCGRLKASWASSGEHMLVSLGGVAVVEKVDRDEMDEADESKGSPTTSTKEALCRLAKLALLARLTNSTI
jgi:hypothetical protein